MSPVPESPVGVNTKGFHPWLTPDATGSGDRGSGQTAASSSRLRDSGHSRSCRLLKSAGYTFVGKGAVLLSSAVSVPLALRYLGPELFGVWITISSTVALLVVCDLGVSNAVTNVIAEAYATDNKALASECATSALGLMTCISGCIAAFGAAAYPFISWEALFPVHGVDVLRLTRQAAAAGFMVYLIGLPSGLAPKLLGGYQEMHTAAIFLAGGSASSVLGIALVIWLRGGMLGVVLAGAGAWVIANYVCLGWLWRSHMRWLSPRARNCTRSMMKRLISGGSDLFILQAAGLIVFNSDSLVIAHYRGLTEVVPYGVTWRLVGYAAALQAVVTPALWPGYAEAFVRGDIPWMRKTLASVMKLTIGITGTASVGLMIWGRQLIRAWAGAGAVPSEPLVIAMCAWVLISAFMGNTATILLATNQTRLQTRLSVIAAILNLGLSITLVQRIGSIGVVLGTIISYLVVLVVPQTWKVCEILALPEREQLRGAERR